jgi:hypothetical protein
LHEQIGKVLVFEKALFRAFIVPVARVSNQWIILIVLGFSGPMATIADIGYLWSLNGLTILVSTSRWGRGEVRFLPEMISRLSVAADIHVPLHIF